MVTKIFIQRASGISKKTNQPYSCINIYIPTTVGIKKTVIFENNPIFYPLWFTADPNNGHEFNIPPDMLQTWEEICEKEGTNNV